MCDCDKIFSSWFYEYDPMHKISYKHSEYTLYIYIYFKIAGRIRLVLRRIFNAYTMYIHKADAVYTHNILVWRIDLHGFNQTENRRAARA